MKRIFDVIVSFCLIICCMPIYIVIILVLFIKKDQGVFYTQERIGKDLKPFKLFKFKTMSDEKDSLGNLLPNNQRITTLGKTLRELSLDELPQLFNIMKGDMSLVGPRPLLKKYNALYSDEQLQRFKVKPGVTGLAQVSGRNSISWKEKFSFDVEYVKNQSLLFDLQILIRTAKIVFLKSGVNQSTEATMEPFNGKN